MKFTTDRDVLVAAVSKTVRTAETTERGNVLCELAGNQLRLRAGNGPITIDGTTTVTGTADGTVDVPAKLFNGILRSLPTGPVKIALNGNLEIVSGRNQFNVTVLGDEPAPAEPVVGDKVVVDGAAFGDGIATVKDTASTDQSRRTLTGVLFEATDDGVVLVTTDSYRLAVRELPGQALLGEGATAIVPADGLAEVQRVLRDADIIGVSFGERHARFEADGWSVTTSLISGDYPNYRRLLPDEYNSTLNVDGDELADALKRAKQVVDASSAPTGLTLTVGEPVTVEAADEHRGQGRCVVDGDYTSDSDDELTIMFNTDYLIAGLSAAPTKEVQIGFNGSLKPVVITCPDDPTYKYLVMPVNR